MAADDHAAVLKVWSKRHRDLARNRNQVVCRLHAVLCELIPAATRSSSSRRGLAGSSSGLTCPAPSR